MKTKHLFNSLLLTAILAVAASSASAGGVGSISFGVTNATIAPATTATALGQSNVTIDQQDYVTLEFKAACVTTNASTAVITFGRVDGNGNIETYPTQSWSIPTATTGAAGTLVTNNVVAYYTYNNTLGTNALGAAYGLALISINNNSSGGTMYSPTVTVWKKRLQAAN
jgi:hypothetical protein